MAVVYHFFPHYRGAIVRDLAREGTCDWTFYGDLHDFDRDSGIAPMAFPPDIRFRRLKVTRIFRSIIWQHGVVQLAWSDGCDVLVLLGVPKYLSMWAAAIIGRLAGKRVLFWTHGWTYRPRGPLRYVRRYFFRLGHAIMTYGRWAKQIALEEGFDPARVHVIGNSLDLSAQRRALAAMQPDRPVLVREELFGSSDAPVVVCLSRLIAVRRLDLLIEAVASLRPEGIRANVILVGEGPERPRLQAMAKRLDVHVAFIGACYDENRICELTRASNVMVAPGKVGLAAIHSMSYGVPVVTHGDHENQMPEFEAVIPGRTGSLFQLGNVASLAAAMRPWLTEGFVKPEVSQSCQKIVSRFWSIEFQRAAIMAAIDGRPANDLRNTKEV